MRKILIAFATTMIAGVTVAGPAAAQSNLPRGGEVEAMAPAFDRATDAFLDIDVGPFIDALDPYRRDRRPRHRTLRDMAREDDPYFEQRLRGRIYGTTAGLARAVDAFAAAEPRLRRSFRQMERDVDDALAGIRDPLPPGQVDDDWDPDFDEDPEDEPYED